MGSLDGIQYLESEDGSFTDLYTGEILTKTQIIKTKERQRVEDFAVTTNELLELGYENVSRIVKYKGVKYPCVSIKQGYAFGKVHRVAIREIMKDGQLSLNARAFIATFEPYISFPYNSVIINSQHPNQAKLESTLGLKRTAMYKVLRELEAHDIIKRVKTNHVTIIYFNPFLYASGGIIHSDTYDLFEGSMFNPLNNNLPTID